MGKSTARKLSVLTDLCPKQSKFFKILNERVCIKRERLAQRNRNYQTQKRHMHFRHSVARHLLILYCHTGQLYPRLV